MTARFGFVAAGLGQRLGRFCFADGRCVPAACGKAGLIQADQKQEGDQKTPLGSYEMETIFLRPELMKAVQMAGITPKIDCREITAEMGWCDDGQSDHYNQLVSLPFAASHEKLWRDDGIYDGLIVLSHNRHPVQKGKGSAIFLHLARPDFSPTAGCIAIGRQDFMTLLQAVRPHDKLAIALD